MRQFTPVEWLPNDRIYDLLAGEVLDRGQIGANVSEEQATLIFRVDESRSFLQKLGIYQIIRLHVPQDLYIYIILRNSFLNNLVRFSKFAEVSADVSRSRSPDLIIYYTELHSAADKISNPISRVLNHLT